MERRHQVGRHQNRLGRIAADELERFIRDRSDIVVLDQPAVRRIPTRLVALTIKAATTCDFLVRAQLQGDR